MGRLNGRRRSDVLAPMFVRAVPHVDLLDVADRTRGGAGMRDAQRDNPLVRVGEHTQHDRGG